MKPLLILPFLRIGERLFQATPMPISLVELTRHFGEAPLATLQEFSWSFVHAITGWLVVSPLLLALIFSILLAIFNLTSWPWPGEGGSGSGKTPAVS
ncbi:MAG: hypothetical protein KDL31_04895 [Kiritimatiellae bacterium]|nr:hypothetical protein [Kiritimatiellia bacterium]